MGCTAMEVITPDPATSFLASACLARLYTRTCGGGVSGGRGWRGEGWTGVVGKMLGQRAGQAREWASENLSRSA